jgi:hypothetical protein
MEVAMRTGALLPLFVLAACATLPAPREVQRAFEYDASFDAVWFALIDVFGEMNFPIDNLEKDSGIITTDWIGLDLDDGYADCGEPGLNLARDHEGMFNVVVRGRAEDTRLTVNTSFQVEWVLDTNIQTIECVSTGSLEKRISELVSKKIS